MAKFQVRTQSRFRLDTNHQTPKETRNPTCRETMGPPPPHRSSFSLYRFFFCSRVQFPHLCSCPFAHNVAALHRVLFFLRFAQVHFPQTGNDNPARRITSGEHTDPQG